MKIKERKDEQLKSKKRLRILHLSKTALAGSPIRISEILNKYTNNVSKCIVEKNFYGDRSFDKDLLFSELTKSRLIKLIRESDIIHFHNYWDVERFCFEKRVPIKIFDNKKVVLQYHSEINRIINDTGWSRNKILNRKDICSVVIAQKQALYYPLMKRVPNLIDIYDDQYKPRKSRGDLIKICYSPSNRYAGIHEKNCGGKSYDLIVSTLKKIKKVKGYIIENKPHKECLKIKKECDIGIDEIETGGYHLNSLENFSLGLANFSWISNDVARIVCETVGCNKEELPWINVNKETFLPMLKKVVSNMKKLVITQKKSRQFMEKFWDPRKLIGIYIKVYKNAPKFKIGYWNKRLYTLRVTIYKTKVIIKKIVKKVIRLIIKN